MPQNSKNRFLDVPAMIDPLIENYDEHVNQFIEFLESHLDCKLVYEGPFDIHQHILNRTIYSCSVLYNGSKLLHDVFPIMIGSNIDLCIRHRRQRENFSTKTNESVPKYDTYPYSELDIGRGFFIINGNLRQLPLIYTNDATNTHVIQQKIVRVYTYDEYDRGKQLNWYVEDGIRHKAGEIIIVHNDGSETQDENSIRNEFFSHCPYSVKQTPYMQLLLSCFDIDDLSNKIVMTPGHLFKKLFLKYLYIPILENNPTLIKSRHCLVVNSIVSGNVLHVLSRKTFFHKENISSGKMTNVPTESSFCEISDSGKVFKEKSIGCYREVNMQIYPYIPYNSQLVNRQTSQKVNYNSLPPFHKSHLGFFCHVGCSETKIVGRTTVVAKNVKVSTSNELDCVFHDGKSCKLWEILNLQQDFTSIYFVVVNECCIPVTKKCFETIDLVELKIEFGLIECYVQDQHFILIRYKTGILFKRMTENIWITPRDEMFWGKKLFGVTTKEELVLKLGGNDYVEGYHTDLSPNYMHNSATKTILAKNASKTGVFAYDSKYVYYFMDTVSAYISPEALSYLDVVLPPKEGCKFSEMFVLKAPRVIVTYMSFLGMTQEDCIVRRKDVKAFDCVRVYTLRMKYFFTENIEEPNIIFHPVRGDPDENDFLVGTVVCHNHGREEKKFFRLEAFSLHVRIVDVNSQVKKIFFKKAPFRVTQYYISKGLLSITVDQLHESSTGDKLCSFHGQKGVLRISENVPLLDEKIVPDLIVNPYCMFRMTPGQILEGLYEGNGRDAEIVRNSDGKIVPNASAFYAKTFYFPIAYWSNEHMYAPTDCVLDKVLNQAVKGRSRGGGMRLGNMELLNGMRGNGIASSFEEKFFEHGDATLNSIPKSVELVTEDAKFFKCNIQYEQQPSVVEIEKKIKN